MKICPKTCRPCLFSLLCSPPWRVSLSSRITIPERFLPPGTIGILVIVTHCTSGFASAPYVLHDQGWMSSAGSHGFFV